MDNESLIMDNFYGSSIMAGTIELLNANTSDFELSERVHIS